MTTASRPEDGPQPGRETIHSEAADDIARQQEIARESGFTHISELVAAELRRLSEGRQS